MCNPINYLIEKIYHPTYKQKVANIIANLCSNHSHILDIGCHDGTLINLIHQINPTLNIIGLEIDNSSIPKCKRIIYDGSHIPCKDNTFDIVLCIDSLHHTPNTLNVLIEASRVSKKTIIIKDHCYYSKLSLLLIKCTDYITNYSYHIPCPYNFYPLHTWKKLFEIANLNLISQPKNLHYGYGINERYNPLFLLHKQ